MNTQTRFINELREPAMKLWDKFGILPSVAIGQAALESNWGRSRLATDYNNLFGIKGEYQGNSAMMNTWEVYGGKRYDVRAGFRAYPDQATSILDYGAFLTANPRYSKAIGLTDYRVQIHAIHQAGYATDPDYAKKVISIIQSYKLYELDDMVLDKPKHIYPARIKIGNKETKAYNIGGVVYVPARFVAENLGRRFKWDNESKTIIIEK